MATIRNARDVLLQAAGARIVAVNLPTNVTVPTDQVTGLPAVVAASKQVDLLSSSLIFQIAKSGAVTPATITLTPTLRNLANAPTLSLVSGTVTGGLTLVSGSFTLNPANMTTDSVTIRATVVENSITYTSDLTVAKIREGLDGINGWNSTVIYAYKRSATLPTLKAGAVVYTFSSASITTPATDALANGWTKTIPAGTDPLYVIAASTSAASTAATDAVADSDWTAPVILASDGVAGLNGATVLIYQRNTVNTAPALPNVASTYTFATGGLSGLTNGWSQTIPTSGGDYLFVSTATASSIAATDSIASGEWSAGALMSANGLHNAVTYAYKRSATLPTMKAGAVTYTFSSASITTPAADALANGWTKTVPAGTDPLYVSMASASASGTATTDAIADTEWSAPVILASDGVAGAAGLHGASVLIYQRNTVNTAPALPNASSTYTFATGGLTGLTNGWSQTIPTSGGAYLFVSTATAASTGTSDAIASGEWSAGALMASNGTNGTNAVFATLDKDSWVFPADVGGIVSSYSGGNATIKLMQGATDETSLWTLTSANSTGVTAAAVSVGGLVTVTGFNSANDTGTVTITATRSGYPTLSRVFNLSKAKAGAAGSTGARGSMMFYVSQSAGAWTDALADSTSNVNGGKSLNDVVTQYKTASSWAETRFWNGTAWVVITATIDGNLLVSGSVGAAKISVTNLSSIKADLGTITAGSIHGAYIHGGSFTSTWAWPAAGGTGFHLSSSGLLLGNYNDLKWFQVSSNGDVSAPQFSITNGVANFAGALNAASGTFAGTLTAAAVNAVNTINIAGNAVTIPIGVSYSDTILWNDGVNELVLAQTGTFTSSGGSIFLTGDIRIGTTINSTLTLRRNGTTIKTILRGANQTSSFTWVDYPGAGNVYYQVVLGICSGGPSQVLDRCLFSLECKK